MTTIIQTVVLVYGMIFVVIAFRAWRDYKNNKK